MNYNWVQLNKDERNRFKYDIPYFSFYLSKPYITSDFINQNFIEEHAFKNRKITNPYIGIWITEEQRNLINSKIY